MENQLTGARYCPLSDIFCPLTLDPSQSVPGTNLTDQPLCHPANITAPYRAGTHLGKASKNQVRCVLNATRMPDISGECSTTPPNSCRDARSTVGTVPMLCP